MFFSCSLCLETANPRRDKMKTFSTPTNSFSQSCRGCSPALRACSPTEGTCSHLLRLPRGAQGRHARRADVAGLVHTLPHVRKNVVFQPAAVHSASCPVASCRAHAAQPAAREAPAVAAAARARARRVRGGAAGCAAGFKFG